MLSTPFCISFLRIFGSSYQFEYNFRIGVRILCKHSTNDVAIKGRRILIKPRYEDENLIYVCHSEL